jgi:anti-sigma factor RsiW
MPGETCTRLLSKLSDYIDGDLPPDLLAEIEAHLATCPNCRLAADTLRKTVSLYQTAPQPALSAAGRARLLKFLKLDDSDSTSCH